MTPDPFEQFDQLRDELRDQALRTTNLVYRIDLNGPSSRIMDAGWACTDLCNRLIALAAALTPVAVDIPGIGTVRFPSVEARDRALAELAELEEDGDDAC